MYTQIIFLKHYKNARGEGHEIVHVLRGEGHENRVLDGMVGLF